MIKEDLISSQLKAFSTNMEVYIQTVPLGQATVKKTKELLGNIPEVNELAKVMAAYRLSYLSLCKIHTSVIRSFINDPDMDFILNKIDETINIYLNTASQEFDTIEIK